jgi:hypothetical protein
LVFCEDALTFPLVRGLYAFPASRPFLTFLHLPAAAVVLTALASLSCKANATEAQPFEPVEVMVDDENHVPLGNVFFLDDTGRAVASTGGDGIAHMQVFGAEGTANEVILRCPEGYSADQSKMVIKRMTMNATNGATRYAMHCRRLLHTLVIAIRTDETINRKKSVPLAGLPITYLGVQKALTDSSGAATLSAEGAEGQTFEFTVVTNQPENATLNPQNVTQTFRIGASDQVVPFSPTFSRPQKKVVQHRAYVRSGPQKF